MTSSIRAAAVAAIFLASLMMGTAPARAASTYTATGVKCTIVGTAGNNTLTGTNGNDVICGLGGNDTINGGGGNDTIDGGTGNDSLSGGTGNDTLLGGTGKDTFNGGTGIDTASYADHSLAVIANIDGAGNDGAAGEGDTVKTDIENLTGGSGNDTLTGDGTTNVVSGGSGDDTITGGNGADTITGGDGADTISGGSGNDTSSGGAGEDTITGGTGNDIINGGDGNDALSGDAGADTVHGDGGLNSCSVDALDTYDSGTCDIGGPRVTSFSIDRTSIDTSGSSQQVTVTFEVIDDLAGISSWNGAGCWVGAAKVGDELLQVPPDSVSLANVVASNSFGNTDVVYTATFSFPQYSAQGDWTIGGFTCYDNVHNEGRYFEGVDGYWTYRSNGTPIDLTGNQRISITRVAQTGVGDTALPQLVGVTKDTNSIDTSNGPATVQYRLHLTDDTSICTSCYMSFYVRAPNGGALVLSSALVFADGTMKDGYWEASVTFPKYWTQGVTEIYLMGVRDQSGKENRYGGGWTPVPASAAAPVTQTGIGDATPPTITKVELVGAAPNTRASDATVTLKFTITDNLSGLALDDVGRTQFVFTAEVGGTQARGFILSRDVVTSSLNGRLVVVTATFTLPRLSPLGKWNLVWVMVKDGVGNYTQNGFPPFFFTNG